MRPTASAGNRRWRRPIAASCARSSLPIPTPRPSGLRGRPTSVGSTASPGCGSRAAWLGTGRGRSPPISISADYDQSKAAGTLVVGSPDTVGRILTAQAERIRQNYLVLMLAFGSLTHAQEMRSLELFTGEIMPKLAAMNYEDASPAPALATA